MSPPDSDNQSADPQLAPPVEKKKTKHLKPDQSRKELDTAIKGANDTLAEITTSWQLLPITLSLDRAKIGATKKSLTGNNNGMFSLPINDVINVDAETGFMVNRVKITVTLDISEKPFEVGPFSRHDAQKFASIAQGYLIALKRRIDTSSLKPDELADKLKDLGKDENVTYKEV